MPAISIIIPNFNTEKYIGETIASVLDQTFSDFELIIVDDGSTDHSVDVIRSFQDKDARIKLVQNPHLGLSHTRMEGFRHANGEWISYIDSDDLVNPHLYDVMMKQASCPEVDLVQVRNICFHEKNEILSRNTVQSEKQCFRCSGKESVLWYRGKEPEFDIEFGPWGKLYRRSLFDLPDIQTWLTEGAKQFPYNYFNDFSLIPRLQFFSRTVILTDYFGYYHREHSGSISSTVSVGATHYERIRVMESNILFYQKHQFPEGVLIHITNYFLGALSYWYKGWLSDRSSSLFREHEEYLEAFYRKYIHYLKSVKTQGWSSAAEKMVIYLWRISHSLWRLLVGNLYFEKKYHFKKNLTLEHTKH